ncbi:hypothetical protein FNW25_07975 [Flavobacterium franklandianum]|uniref:Lipocalin-like domain-containing protein n=1 Tax=Flavobacterium franklandianum TaxID=2594430 RepID=A0A553CQS4_9FLAO|nr:hypothetical protein [Flavobacterium franklandianum]TRX22744.1 hypothetical protein FNW17_02965 [Flavobacterium franklandianum]TRX26552.1 hypothetical protein FNW25_07975 [Flavobacterium franklandianum]
MKKTKYILITISILFLTSFSNIRKEDNLLLKVWTYENYNNEILTYKSQRNFSKKSSGIELKENGILKVKQNVGWCGTSPITYEIVDGKWKMTTDSIIHLEYKNWNGNVYEKRKIVGLTSDKLVLQILKK